MNPWPILVASLFGSAHCAAMCGLIAGAAGRRPAEASAYHGARLLGYLVLGVVGGLVGTAAERLGLWAGITGFASRAAGFGLVAFGLTAMLASLGLRTPGWRGGHGWLAPVAARGRTLRPLGRGALLGLVTAALPCGWLYAFVAVAAGTGNPWSGAAAMAVFWLGTVPAVAGAGLLVSRLAGPLRARLPLLAGAVMVVFGLVTALARPSPAHHPAPSAAIDDHRPR